MAQFWSDYTDFVITSIDKSLEGKYKITLRDLLSDPEKYTSMQGIENTVKNMQADVTSFIDSSIASMPEEKTALEDALSRADSVTKQLLDSISLRSKQYKVPVIKPVSVGRDTAKDEVISVGTATQETLALVEKLASLSVFIADMSSTYENALIGSWLFSGSKDYIMNVFMPDNDVAMLESTKAELNDMLESTLAVIQGV